MGQRVFPPPAKVIQPLSGILSTAGEITNSFNLVPGDSVQFKAPQLIDHIKASLGYYPEVLKKCTHCGQWGAIMCACRSCGAPIDP